MQLSFFSNITTARGKQIDLEHDDEVQCLTEHDVRADKDGQLYSPALYDGKPQRADCNVVAMSAVVIDVDNDAWIMVAGKKTKVCADKPTAPDDHEDNLGDIAYFWHSTHSNRPNHPKFRFIIPVSRNILPIEWPVVFAGAMAMLGNDENIDGSCADLSRAYYLPSCPPEYAGCKFSGYHAGPLIDPDYLIEISGTAVDYSQPSGDVNGMLPTIRAEGRNNTLKSIVSACLERGEAVEKIITEVLVADAQHEQPLFSDPGETQYSGMPIEIAALKFVAGITASHARNAVKRGQVPDIPHIRTEAAYATPENIEVDYSMKPVTTHSIPRDLLHVPGMVGQIVVWLEKTAIKSQPILSLAAGLAAAGVLMGRKVQTVSGLRTNMLVVGLGETSCGKDHARQRIKDLFVKSGAGSMIGAEELASDTGLLTAVAKSPAILFQLDEFGRMLKSIAGDMKGFKADIPSVIMKLDSAAGSTFIGRAYADKEKARADIVQPNVCIYGTTVPSRFFAALTPAEIEDGFIPRLLVFASEDPSPKRQRVDVRSSHVPDKIVEQVRWWADYQGHMGGNMADFMGGHPEPRVVDFDPVAEKLFGQFETYVREQMDKLRSRGTGGLWGKVEAQAQRLALIYACSEDPLTCIINGTAAEWGITITMILTQNMVYQAGQHISSNQTEATVKKILRDIFNSGASGISRRDLARRNRGILAKPFRDILKALQDDGEIFLHIEGKSEMFRDAIYQKKKIENGNAICEIE